MVKFPVGSYLVELPVFQVFLTQKYKLYIAICAQSIDTNIAIISISSFNKNDIINY